MISINYYTEYSVRDIRREYCIRIHYINTILSIITDQA